MTLGSRSSFGVLLLVLLGAVLYFGVLNAPFILDDYSSIVENESVRSVPQSLNNISSNRYLTSLSFAFNYAIGGLKPFGYHLINNFIHVSNALLVYYLVILTFRAPCFSNQQSSDSSIHPEILGTSRFTDSPSFIAFSSAFIFISHPIQTQAVTYIAQRATSMATMFYLLSLVMYIKFRLLNTTPLNPPLSRGEFKRGYRASWIMYLCSIISAIFAMKTKEIAFTLPIIITFFEFSFFNSSPSTGPRKSNFKRVLYLLPILLTLLIIPLSMVNFKAPVEIITQNMDIHSRETGSITRTDYLLTQLRVIMTYLRLLIFPINQNLDYRYPIYKSFWDLQVFFSFLLLLSILGSAIYLMRKSRVKMNSSSLLLNRSRQEESVTDSPIHRFTSLRLIAFGIFWFFITLSVESSVIPIRDVIVEHRLYLPSVGLFIGFAALADYLLSDKRIKVVLMVILVVILSVGTYSRNAVWKDPQKLWEDVITKAPNNARAYNNLGVVFKNNGEYDKAIEQFEKSLRADKNYTAVYFNIGDVQYRLGNYEDAVVYLKQALTGKLTPQLHLDILNKLGRTYSARGQTESAIDAFKEAIRVYPTAVAPYNNLGVQYIKAGKFDIAVEILEKALKMRDEQYIRSNLSIAYTAKQERDKNTAPIKK